MSLPIVRFHLDVVIKDGDPTKIREFGDNPETVKRFAGFFNNALLETGMEESTLVQLAGGGAHIHQAGDLQCLMATTEGVYRPIR